MSKYQPSIFVKYLDLYGTDFKLNINGEPEYKTLFGSLIGLLSILFMLTLAIIYFVELIQKKEVLVVYKEDETTLPVTNMTQIQFCSL